MLLIRITSYNVCYTKLLRVLRIAASLDQGSEHPLAQAIVAEAKRRDLPLSKATDFESSSGIGVRGKVDGHTVAIGNTVLMEENSVV